MLRIHVDFFEIGASGHRHDRQSCIETVMNRVKTDNSSNRNWEMKDFECRKISNDTYLLNYALIQNKQRLTQRVSIWQFNNGLWEMIYHQGTIIT
jgi:hypothetical protein